MFQQLILNSVLFQDQWQSSAPATVKCEFYYETIYQFPIAWTLFNFQTLFQKIFYKESSFLISSRFLLLMSPKHWYNVVTASCRFIMQSTKGIDCSFLTGTRTHDGLETLCTLIFVKFSPSFIKSSGCLFVVLICGSFDVDVSMLVCLLGLRVLFLSSCFAFWRFASATFACTKSRIFYVCKVRVKPASNIHESRWQLAIWELAVKASESCNNHQFLFWAQGFNKARITVGDSFKRKDFYLGKQNTTVPFSDIFHRQLIFCIDRIQAEKLTKDCRARNSVYKATSLLYF